MVATALGLKPVVVSSARSFLESLVTSRADCEISPFSATDIELQFSTT